MPPPDITDKPLAPELESIASAAADRLRVQADANPQHDEEHQQRVVQVASAAIAAGLGLSAIADAERIGHARARHKLGTEVLRQVRRAARRKREAQSEYEHTVLRAARLGLAHRDIATEAEVAHGTVRALIARTQTPPDNSAPSAPSAATDDFEPAQPHASGSPSPPAM